MRFFVSVRYVGIVLALVSSFLLSGCARSVDPWKELRSKQPAALHLKLTLPKAQFSQGEIIDATLEYSNDDSIKPYSLQVNTDWIIFDTVDEKGALKQGHSPMSDARWLLDHYNHEYLSAEKTIGYFSLKQPVNYTIHFDKPGVYTLCVRSKIAKGAYTNSTDTTTLVSNTITITILPLSPENESNLIAAALKKIKDNSPSDDPNTYHPDKIKDAIMELAFMQTPSSQDALFGLMVEGTFLSDSDNYLEESILCAHDPAAEAERILTLVKSGKIVPNSALVVIYRYLTEYSLREKYRVSNPDKKASDILCQHFPQECGSAKKELIDAALMASEGKGPAYVEALWTAFEVAYDLNHVFLYDTELDRGKARTALVQHQLELPRGHVMHLLSFWREWGGVDFLPLIRREALSPINNPTALIALAELRPEEARPLIIKDLSSPDSKLFADDYYYNEQVQWHFSNWGALDLMGTIPPMPLPQFDSLFRKKLAEKKRVIEVIRCFGSPALLPDVRKSYFENNIEYDCPYRMGGIDGEKCLFSYWLRNDFKTAAPILEKRLGDRSVPWTIFRELDKFTNPWTADYLPFVKSLLQSKYPVLVFQAIDILEKRDNESSINSVIQALEKLRAYRDEMYSAQRTAEGLLLRKRWHYTEEQKRRLESLATSQ